MQFPTGGKAHEPKGMIRCNSEADSIVWMKEDCKTQDAVCHFVHRIFALDCFYIPELYFLHSASSVSVYGMP